MKAAATLLAVFTFLTIVSCKDSPDIKPDPDSDFMLKKAVQLKDFTGTWVRNNNDGSAYKKISIQPESNGSYYFEYFHYSKYSNSWEADEYTPPQSITESSFTSADASGFLDPTPYIRVKITIPINGTSIVKYNIKRGVRLLNYDSNDFYKEEQ